MEKKNRTFLLLFGLAQLLSTLDVGSDAPPPQGPL
jgi:hypothetical protein